MMLTYKRLSLTLALTSLPFICAIWPLMVHRPWRQSRGRLRPVRNFALALLNEELSRLRNYIYRIIW